jgi:2-polyprenyl-3-methyl-5-hydroxy-6-metoxy-1,4-benzoquinol methylase
MSRLRAYAPAWIKQLVWNRKHRNATVDPADCPHEMLDSLTRLDPNAAIADFGCGIGNLRAALRARGWKGHFVGIDTSDRAIQEAKRSEDSNAEWHVSTIEDFPGLNQKVSTICFCESIYYVQPRFVPAVLARCQQALSSGGRILIRVAHKERHLEHIELLMRLGAQAHPPIYVLQEK